MSFKKGLMCCQGMNDVAKLIIKEAMYPCPVGFTDLCYLDGKYIELSSNVYLMCDNSKFILISKDKMPCNDIFEFEICNGKKFCYNATKDDVLISLFEAGFGFYDFKNIGKTTKIAFIFKDKGEECSINFNKDFIFDIHDDLLVIEFDNNIEIKTSENSVMYISEDWILNICYSIVYVDSIIFCERKNNTFFYSNNLTDLKNFLEHRKEENDDV